MSDQSIWLERELDQEARKVLPEYKKLLEELVGHENRPCHFDHHGDCQEHVTASGEAGYCTTRAARELLGLDNG